MELNLEGLLPTLSQSMDGIGFLFGAGASFQAGYPLMTTLTRQVIDGLTSTEAESFSAVLLASGKSYDRHRATPNIEEIADLTIAHSINMGEARFSSLELRLRELIVESLLAVKEPELEHHVKFFEGLRSRTFGLPCTVWIPEGVAVRMLHDVVYPSISLSQAITNPKDGYFYGA